MQTARFSVPALRFNGIKRLVANGRFLTAFSRQSRSVTLRTSQIHPQGRHCGHAKGSFVMHTTTQATYQLVSIFGGNYVPEQHGHDTGWRLSHPKERAFAEDFDEMLRALRAALSLR
jgi:hypothetical protein